MQKSLVKNVFLSVVMMLIGLVIGLNLRGENVSQGKSELKFNTAGTLPSQREAIEKMREQGVSSVLCTNLDENKKPTDRIRNILVPTKVYDVSYIVYSKSFGEKYGYPLEYVSEELDERTPIMEMRVVTEGAFIRGYLNILVKKNIGLEVPEISYVARDAFDNIIRFRFPKKIKGYKETTEQYKYRMKQQEAQHGWVWENYYSQNFYLATLDGRPDGKGNWEGTAGFNGNVIQEYSKEYYEDYDYFSISIGCGPLTTNILEQVNSSIWIRSIDKPHKLMIWCKETDFIKFKIPQKLIKKILPIMEETESYNFFQVIRTMKQEGNSDVNK